MLVGYLKELSRKTEVPWSTLLQCVSQLEASILKHQRLHDNTKAKQPGKVPRLQSKVEPAAARLSALIEETERPTAPLMQETKRPGPASPQPLLTESIFLDEEDGLNKFG
ncbi:hypothetical protein PGT21_026449 [Puccinia graminis f. sp. tritici]|nr:hypothetical protein PGT21_026449 [Puccinia graminis f. sp. tritici]KAA1090329.1 hypothetical protein PGTUg99_006092 [Puccinia graminis f. sp. tritici]